MMHDIEDRSHDRQGGIDRKPHHHVSDLADMQKGECSSKIRLYDCTHYPSQHGQTGSPKEKMSRIGKVFQEDQCEKAKENIRSEEHTSELQSRGHLVCRLLLEKK